MGQILATSFSETINEMILRAVLVTIHLMAELEIKTGRFIQAIRQE